MNPDRPTFYITTPIYYVNDKPHIGHVYTTTVCDTAARFQRLAGRDVFFLTGTDEHGVKIEKAARQFGVSPKALADENSAHFQSVLADLRLTNDDFIRTTQQRHVLPVQRIAATLLDSGDIYLGRYEGWYDEGQEEFVPDARAKEQDYKSTISGNPLVRMVEENFFFRLSAYQERLERHYADHPDFVRPEARRNEMLGRLRDGLQDVPVSRTSFSWGIPVPGHDRHVLWVWLDALSNYITAIGVGPDRHDLIPEADDVVPRGRARYWPVDYHVIGKEILFFHALFWPAVLMALEIPLPRCVYAHSFWISEGRKMSKSLGNFIDLAAIRNYTDEFSLDALRWMLVTQGPLGSTDTDFTRAKFIEVYNNDLANTVGNSISRVVNMITRYFDGAVPPDAQIDVGDGGEFDWPDIARQTVQTVHAHMDRLELAQGFAEALALVRKVDAFIEKTRPFALAKDETKKTQLAAVLHRCAEALRIATILLWPVMPDKMQDAWDALGISIDTDDADLEALCAWGAYPRNATVTKGDPLFPRYVEKPVSA